jgi:membrane-bound inhibitor of C-type lysozyme
MPSKNKKVLLAVLGALLVIGILYLALFKGFDWLKGSGQPETSNQPGTPAQPEPIACTLEAKICPDGSSVGRVGPNCEFTPCPAETVQSSVPWKTATSSQIGLSFRYPEKLTTEYIHTVNWPPQIQVLDKKFTCNETGVEIAQGGQTVKITVDNREYCVTKSSEGAAGSTYTQYAYTFPKNGQTITLTFTLRTVQCGNYDDPQKTACEQERESFDLDGVVDRIAQTVSLVPKTAAGTLSRPKDENIASQLADCLPKSDMASKAECERLLRKILNFDDCVNAGFAIMKSNPPQCATPDGRNFTGEMAR